MGVLSIQYCSLAIIVILFYLSLRHNRLPIKSYSLFMLALINALICVVLDIGSLYAIRDISSIGMPLTKLVCKLYIVSLTTETFVALYYILGTTRHERRFRVYKYIAVTAEIASAFLLLVLPIGIDSSNPDMIHTYGPSTIVTYASCIFFILFTVFICIYYRKYLVRRRLTSVLTWMGIWFASAFVQYFFHTVQIVAFAMVLGLLILFGEVENPDSYMDPISEMLTGHALSLWLNQNLNKNKVYSAFEINVRNESDYVYNEDLYNSIVVRVSRFLDSFHKTLIFKNEALSYLLIFEDISEMKEALAKARGFFDNTFTADGVEIKLDAIYLSIPDLSVIDSSNELFQVRDFYIHRKPDGDIFEIGDKEVAGERNRRKIFDMVSRAIKEDRLEIFYQPIYSFDDRSFTSAEALVRIRDLSGNIIFPGDFIPVIETSNMIESLGETVFENVCRFISEADIKHLGLDFIEVNLSARQCSQPDLADHLIDIIQRYNVNPSQINLEITESAQITSKKILIENMHRLMQMGVRFALDDFGTGRSNIDYIINIPVSIIKFDRELTQSYFTNNKSRYIMENIVKMIKQLNLKVVSEGVETEDQLETLRKLGVDNIQGYYFSKPLPQGEFIDFLTEKNLVRG